MPERKIQPTPALPQPEAGQEQGEGQNAQTADDQQGVSLSDVTFTNTGLRTPQESMPVHADAPSFTREHIHFARLKLLPVNVTRLIT